MCIRDRNEDYHTFCRALKIVNETLAKKMAGDGEGCTALFEVKVVGAEKMCIRDRNTTPAIVVLGRSSFHKGAATIIDNSPLTLLTKGSDILAWPAMALWK